MPTIIPAAERKVPTKFQHLVLYTKDHQATVEWYQKIFRLQFSAKNHPDSSAAMRVIKQIMYFYSFGYYHHDLAFVTRKGVKPDNTSMLYFSLRLKSNASLEKLKTRLSEEGVSFHAGRILKSSKTAPGNQSIYFQDPINHYWIEILAGEPFEHISYEQKAGGYAAAVNKKHGKQPKHAMPESMASISPIFRKRWLRELILLPATISGKRNYNKTEDYGVFRDSKCILDNTEQITFFVSNIPDSVKWFESMGFYHTRTSEPEAHPFQEGHQLTCAYLSSKNHAECAVIIEHRDATGNIIAPTTQDCMHVAFELEGNTLQDTFAYFKQNKQLGIQHNYGPAKHNNSKPYGDGESGGNVAVYYYTPDFHNIEFCTDMDCVDNYEGRYGTGIRTLENDVYLTADSGR